MSNLKKVVEEVGVVRYVELGSLPPDLCRKVRLKLDQLDAVALFELAAKGGLRRLESGDVKLHSALCRQVDSRKAALKKELLNVLKKWESGFVVLNEVRAETVEGENGLRVVLRLEGSLV